MTSTTIFGEELIRLLNRPTSEEERDGLKIDFAQILQHDPENLDALLGMAFLLHRDDPDRAVGFFAKLLPRIPDDDPQCIPVQSCAAFAAWSLLGSGEWDGVNPQAFAMVPHAEALAEARTILSFVYELLAIVHYRNRDLAKVTHYVNQGTRHASRGLMFTLALPPDFEIPQSLPRRKARFGESIFRHRTDCGAYGGSGTVLRTWAPEVTADHGTRLRGATYNIAEDAGVAFEISAPDGGASRIVAASVAPSSGAGPGPLLHWQAEVRGLEAGGRHRCRLIAGDGGGRGAGEFRTLRAPAPLPAVATTGRATLNGNTGAALNGGIGGTTLPTRYHFQWGPAADRLEHATPTRAVPAARTARARTVLSHSLERCLQYTLKREFPDFEPATGAPPADAAVRLHTPFGKDRNHMNGVGVSDMVMGWWPFGDDGRETTDGEGGIALDLRDADVEIDLRCALDAKDFLFGCNCQNWVERPADGTRGVAGGAPFCSSWSLTARMRDPGALAGGEWHKLCFTLSGDTNEWSYNGNNPDEQANAARYAFAPLGETLSGNRGNLCFWFLYGDEHDTPEGHLDFHSLSVRYRNASLLAPGGGARLIRWPADSLTDPARLTSGWMGNQERTWMSGPNPKAPLEFVWAFDAPVTLRAVRLHQDTLRPAKRVAVLASSDGETFAVIWESGLPDPRERGMATRPTLHVLAAPRPLRFLKLSILEGHESDFWGLDAIELFGEGADPVPETEPCHVSEELRGLGPGTRVFYRLLAENAQGTSRGDIRCLDLPADARPVLHAARVVKQDETGATFMVRMTAMGSPTELGARFEDGNGEIIEGPPAPAGLQPTPKHMAYRVPGSQGGGEYRGAFVARNEHGESAPLEFHWRAGR